MIYGVKYIPKTLLSWIVYSNDFTLLQTDVSNKSTVYVLPIKKGKLMSL